MALPAVGSKLNSPDHRLFHRIIDIDPAAPDSTIAINSAGVVAINSAVLSTARLLIKSDGTGDSDFPLKLRNSSSVDIFDFRSDGFADHRQQGTTASAMQARPTSVSYAGNSISSLSTRSASDAFNHVRYTVSSGATEVYKIRGDGSVLITYRGTTSNPISALANEAGFVGDVINGVSIRAASTAFNLLRLRTGTTVTQFVFRGDGRFGAGGITSPTATIHAETGSADAIPVIQLDQDDVSEEMIEMNSTAGVGNAIEAAAAKTLTATLFIKATINGATVYIPAGTIA